MDNQLEAMYCVPDETPMVQVFRKYGDGALVAEIMYDEGELVFQTIDKSSLPADEIVEIIRLAKDTLLPPEEEA